MLSDEKLEKVENQIINEKKTVDYDTKEFTIEFLASFISSVHFELKLLSKYSL